MSVMIIPQCLRTIVIVFVGEIWKYEVLLIKSSFIRGSLGCLKKVASICVCHDKPGSRTVVLLNSEKFFLYGVCLWIWVWESGIRWTSFYLCGYPGKKNWDGNTMKTCSFNLECCLLLKYKNASIAKSIENMTSEKKCLPVTQLTPG